MVYIGLFGSLIVIVRWTIASFVAIGARLAIFIGHATPGRWHSAVGFDVLIIDLVFLLAAGSRVLNVAAGAGLIWLTALSCGLPFSPALKIACPLIDIRLLIDIRVFVLTHLSRGSGLFIIGLVIACAGFVHFLKVLFIVLPGRLVRGVGLIGLICLWHSHMVLSFTMKMQFLYHVPAIS